MVTILKSFSLLLLLGTLLVSAVDARWRRQHRAELCEIYNKNWACDNNNYAEEIFRGGAPRNAPVIPLDDKELCDRDFLNTTLALLEEGDEKIELTDGEEAILLIGNTGTGKSTLTYFLAGNNSALVSLFVDEFINLIRDCNGKIGDSTVVSQTIFPDLVVDQGTNTAFYDNPGFLDTRTPCIEIANAYFITKVVHNLKRVKFVIVVNHGAMTSVGSRGEFIDGLKNVLSFIPNIEKFLPSVALVGTKADSAGRDINLRIKQMSTFLTDAKPFLPLEFEEPTLTMVNNLFDTLNGTAQGNYTRMNVFRMPEECGPLSDIDHMVENRANIMNIVMNNLEYTESSPSDFGLSLSSEVTLKIDEMSRELSKKVVDSFDQLAAELFEHLRPQFESDCVTGCDLDTLISDLSLLFSNPDFAQDYSDASVWEGLNFTEVIDRIINPIYFPSGFDLSFDMSESLEKYGRYLEFLKTLQPLSIEISEWFRPLRSLKSSLVQNIRQITTKSNTRAIDLIKGFATNLQNLLKGQMSQDKADFEPLLPSLTAVFSNPDFQSNYDPSVWNGLTFSEIIERITNPSHLPPLLEIPESDKTGLQNSSRYLDELQIYVTDPPLDIPLILWSEPLSTFKSELSTDLTSWSVFISGKTVEAFKSFNSLIALHFAGASTFECLLDSSCEQLFSDLELLFSNPDFAQGYSDESVWKGLNFTEVIDRIINPVYLPAELDLSSDLSETFEKFGRYLDFLTPFQTLSIDISKWYDPLKTLKLTLDTNIQEGSAKLIRTVKSSLLTLTRVLSPKKLEELGKLGVFEKEENLISFIFEVDGAVSGLKAGLETGPAKAHVFVKDLLDQFLKLGLDDETAQNYTDNFAPPLEFFDSMGQPSLVYWEDADDWLKSLTNFKDGMLAEQNWNDFLINLWRDLTAKEYQSDNLGSVKTWWQTLNADITLVTFSSTFWDKFITTSAVKTRKKGDYATILQTDTENKLKGLNDLLSTSLGNSFDCSTALGDNTVSEVTGNFVTVSDILKNNCFEPNVTKTVTVFAAHTIFIDKDFSGVQINTENNIDLILISPTLWYSNPYKINLDGGPGLVGDAPSGPGSPGGPGKPGGKAGNLISMGQNFIGTMTNSAKGGNGGNGANGERGTDGFNGSPRSNFTDKDGSNDGYYYPQKSRCEADTGKVQLISSYYPDYTCDDKKEGSWCHAGDSGVTFTIPGADGGSGSTGGHGGKLGNGGKGGHLYTIHVESSSTENPPVVDGPNGVVGVGGAGGSGGTKGETLTARIDDVQRHAEKWCKVITQSYAPSQMRAQDGQNGMPGSNPQNPEPALPQVFNPADVKAHFATFKSMFLQLKTNQFLSNVLPGFETQGDLALSLTFDI